MGGNDEDFGQLLRRLKAGDEAAARLLVQRHGESLLRAVRRAVRQQLRSQYDAADFVQMAWASFFWRLGSELPPDTPERLEAFLIGIARNKVRMALRDHPSPKRPRSGRMRALEPTETGELEEVADRQLTPPEAAMARERLSRLLQQQEPLRRMIRLRLEGHTFHQIANSVGCCKKTVQRCFRRLRRDRRPL